ncbi:MAG: imidazolonepropionase [Lutibacter sp.]|nr:MAG: imidazolonepropionase [Lutibacter sp.]
MTILFKNIKELIQVRTEQISFVSGKEMNVLPTIKNAYLIIENGFIADFGAMDNCPNSKVDEAIDATGKMILPSWCDSHTHIVYAGNREGEFVDRINGMSYEEIANRGGGILNSAKKLQDISEDELYAQSKIRLEEVMLLGTGAVEIKSGYGLTVDAELKMLRVIKRLKENYPIEIKATFLGAHALPKEYKNNKQAYLELLVDKIMPKIAEEKLAEYVDVFCETGYFSVDETEFILKAGKKYGLIPKIHVNQFTAIGGVQIGVKHNALSVDHLEEMRDEDIEILKNTTTMPVALPSCSYFLSIPYTPARKMIDAGLPLALATDYNPGSTPSGNMNFVVSTACIKMKMTPEEAINAATINGAYAMGLENKTGSITVGKQANLLLSKPINSYGFLPYSFGTNQIEKVYLKGKEVNFNREL